ncbi:MAG: DUF721 domain-containing protein [Puniceicoccales bacterium]|jgi:hypothetical protein|nr:DUF721 domain-containing protein [Puniceicoccales bacterium]
MKFSRKINNLIADFRGLPTDQSQAFFREEVLVYNALKRVCAKFMKHANRSINNNLVDSWAFIIGNKYFSCCSPVRILPDGTLIVKVDNSVIRSELSFETRAILSRLGGLGGCDSIRGIRFIL